MCKNIFENLVLLSIVDIDICMTVQCSHYGLNLQEIDSCQPPTQHTVEYKALKFGDQLDSHVLVPLDRSTFKKDYNISFEFRTYYPNGLFFIASVSAVIRAFCLLLKKQNL